MNNSVTSSFARCNVGRNGAGEEPNFKAQVTATPPSSKDREDLLLRRSKFLIIGMILLLTAFFILFIMIATERANHSEVLRQVGGIEEHSRSIRDFTATFNSTLERLQNDTMGKIDTRMNATEKRVSDTIGELRYFIEQKANKTLGRHVRHTTTTQTYPAVGSTKERERQDSSSELNTIVRKDTAHLTSGTSNESVFTIDIGPLLAKFSATNFDMFTEPRKTIIAGVPLAVTIRLYDFEEPTLYFYINCYSDENASAELPSKKGILYALLTATNSEYAPGALSLSEASAKFELWNFATLWTVAKLRKVSVLINDTIRMKLTVID